MTRCHPSGVSARCGCSRRATALRTTRRSPRATSARSHGTRSTSARASRSSAPPRRARRYSSCGGAAPFCFYADRPLRSWHHPLGRRGKTAHDAAHPPARPRAAARRRTESKRCARPRAAALRRAAREGVCGRWRLRCEERSILHGTAISPPPRGVRRCANGYVFVVKRGTPPVTRHCDLTSATRREKVCGGARATGTASAPTTTESGGHGGSVAKNWSTDSS